MSRGWSLARTPATAQPRLLQRSSSSRWARQKNIALVESVNPKFEDPSVEKAENSRLAARDPSTAVGMRVNRNAARGAARFSPGESRTSNGKCIFVLKI